MRPALRSCSVLVLSLCVLPIRAGAANADADAGGFPRVLPGVPVTAVDLRENHARAHNSPIVAVDPTDSRFRVVASRIDVPGFGCELEVSGDGGRSWLPARPVTRPAAGAATCYAPDVAFDSAGLLYFLFTALHGAGNTPSGVYLTTSSDRAHSFDAPRQVLPGNNFQARMAIDTTLGSRGRIHLVWLHAGGDVPTGGLAPGSNPILAAHSDDGGAGFSAPVQVSDPARPRVVAPALALGPDHAVHVLYYDLQADLRDYQGLEGPAWPDPWSLILAGSTDGGDHFAPGVMVDGQIIPPERVLLIYTMPPPALVADDDGRIFAAWSDGREGASVVLMRRSLDRGRRWQPALRLNDDPPGSGRHHYLPRLALSPDGRIDAAFYDRRNDPLDLRNDVYYTYSTDHGHSFAPGLRVTPVGSDSRIGARYPIPSAIGLVDFGGPPAIWSAPWGAQLAWTDTRDSQPGEQQDVLATEIRLREEPGAPARGGGPGLVAVVAGGVVLASGVTGLLVRRRRRPRLA